MIGKLFLARVGVMMKSSVEMKETALHYARHFGWQVFSVHSPVDGGNCTCGHSDCERVGKHPRTRHGIKDATNDPAIIAKYWTRWPEANIGIHCGWSGVVVIDVDTYHGGRVEDLPLIEADQMTPTARTGGDGLHIYYRAPIGFEVSNSNARLPDGIDVRAGDGYVLAPRSRHVSGKNYEWLAGRAPEQIPMLPLPASLIPLLKTKEELSRLPVPSELPNLEILSTQAGQTHPYVQAILRKELERLAQAREGQRNQTLNTAAFALGQLVVANLVSRTEVEGLLQQAAQSLGLGEREIQKTVHSGLEAGIRNPRKRWPDLSQRPGQKIVRKRM